MTIVKKLKWPILILHNWKGSIQKHHRKSRDLEGRSLTDACLGKPEIPPLTMIDEMPTDGTSTSKKDQDGHGLMKSENFEGIPYPDDDLNNFVKMVMEWWMLFFSSQNCLDNFKKFRTHVVATIVCMTAWCTYTHLLHAHFSAHSACTITFAHLRACHTHAWLKCQ